LFAPLTARRARGIERGRDELRPRVGRVRPDAGAGRVLRVTNDTAWDDHPMGQVIGLPRQQQATHAHERAAAAFALACGTMYVVGFFLAGPMLALFAIGFVFTGQPVAALISIALVAIVWKLTAAAYARL
jgi:hypothetical protein